MKRYVGSTRLDIHPEHVNILFILLRENRELGTDLRISTLVCELLAALPSISALILLRPWRIAAGSGDLQY